MLNLFPPLLFNRIHIRRIEAGYLGCQLRINRSILTRNLNGTTFGGTIFSAADPIYAVLYWQIFARRSESLQVWLKTANIRYRRPAHGTLTMSFQVAEEDVAEAQASLDGLGTALRMHTTEAVDPEGRVCAVVETEVYMRRLGPGQSEVSGF